MRILLIDDHTPFRDALAEVLKQLDPVPCCRQDEWGQLRQPTG